MADPFTWAAIGTAASVGGGILGAIGSMQEGSSRSSMYQYQAGVAKFNTEIAKQNADYALATGETRAMISGMRSKAEIGQTTARMGASGVAVGQGSSKEVLESQRGLATFDQGIIRNNAAREAYGYQVKAAEGTSQVGAYNAAAADAERAGSMKALGSLIGGASSVAGKWSSGTSSGLFSNPFGSTSSGYGGRLSELY